MAAIVVITLSGCSSGPGLDRLPLPAPGSVGETYELTAEFTNVLNLPALAKVRFNGADVGQVRSIEAVDSIAEVRLGIASNVRLPVGTTAELRSATPLGDVFVALHPPAEPSDGWIPEGAVLGVEATSAAATVEDLMASAALLINGGAVRQVVNSINGAGELVGGRGSNVRQLLDSSTDLIGRLSARQQQLNETLDATARLADTLHDQEAILNDVLVSTSPATGVIAENTGDIMDLVTQVSRSTDQLNRFPSLQGTDSRSVIIDLNNLAASFNDIALDPSVGLAGLNRLIPLLLKATAGTAISTDGDVTRIALGSLPDMNYPGDFGMHGPDGTDWHNMVGGVRYEWNVLLSRLYGAHRPGP
ncbi:MCE family protein [Mycolicibacterium brumae]|uniref:MCE family protein n=1 Tax=Mycolicibacterium brumae TaxID=85968 RepID=A0A2G5PEK4_9MYCO|nr:MCE family protein [Mycolicibacterium brumae]PIB76374.1 MCE family protein [Mycolicibacterium brumae]